MRLFVIILLFSIALSAKVTILDRLDLSKFSFDGFSFSEISDLAYDKKEHILYMVSDKGTLFSFKAYFDKKIDLKPLSANYLKRKNGKRLKKWKRDSEGMVLVGDKLYISFEGKPKILQISKKDGRKINKIKIPKALKKAKQRKKNKGLEALAYHSKYGFLTALEYAQKGKKACNQQIFSTTGKVWSVKLQNYKNCAITALEVMDSDNILILERAYSGIFNPFVVTLKKFNLKNGKSEVLAEFNSAKGDDVDNFEGLTKVDKSRYLIVSDDNNNPFANSTLLLLEIK